MTGAHESEWRVIEGMRAELRSAQYTSWIAATGVAVPSALIGEPWGVAVGVVVAAGALARRTALPSLDRGDVTTAVWIATASTWMVTLVIAAIVPESFPVLVVNVAGPPVVGALALDGVELRRLVGTGVAVSVALGAIGFTSPGTGVADAVPSWFFEGVLVVYLAAHVLVISSIVSASNQQYRSTVDDVLRANAALTHSEAELRASRRRVIAVGDAERERLERDIHDGAQQRLVALAVQLRLAAQLTERGATTSATQLESLRDECMAALDELRELARGIYPSVLTERGLDHALRSVSARLPNSISVHHASGIQLDPGDAVAVYFVCLEALQNVAKHGGSEATATVTIDRRDDGLVVEVVDDGPGFDVGAVSHSRGLLNMADRAGALGGELVVESTVGRGTSIRMRLPLADRHGAWV